MAIICTYILGSNPTSGPTEFPLVICALTMFAKTTDMKSLTGISPFYTIFNKIIIFNNTINIFVLIAIYMSIKIFLFKKVTH